jgi:hypothetical protein
MTTRCTATLYCRVLEQYKAVLAKRRAEEGGGDDFAAAVAAAAMPQAMRGGAAAAAQDPEAWQPAPKRARADSSSDLTGKLHAGAE